MSVGTEGPPWWCQTCESWRHTQPCGRDECPTPQDAPPKRPIQPGTLGVPLERRREPTAQELVDPRFEVIWELIKRVDVDYRDGTFSGATGNDVCAVLDALDAVARTDGR